ncbi:hypothetical protein SCH4B_0329 [Ruegeria sp. TrichCH4B]|nr:hypothetical protein SCH4B_0329 [Ruegeria sp. TrichCH4B]
MPLNLGKQIACRTLRPIREAFQNADRSLSSVTEGVSA